MNQVLTHSGRDTRALLFILLPGMAVAAAFVYGGQQQAAVIVAGAAAAVAIVVAPEIGVYLFCLSAALDELVVREEGTVLTPSKVLAPFVLLVHFLLPNPRVGPLITARPFVLVMIAFGFYGILTSVVSVAPLAALRYGAQIVVLVLMVVVAVQRLTSRGAIARALQFAVLGGTIAATMMVGFGVRSRQYSGASLGEFSNPNSTALGLSLAIMCIAPGWVCTRSRVLRMALLLAAPLMLTAAAMTGSRSAIVAVFFAGLLSLPFARGANLSRRLLVPVISAGVVAVTLFYVLQSDLLSERASARLQALVEHGVEASEESRWFIWGAALQTFTTRPWGFGFGNTAFVLGEERGVALDVHSTIVGALVDGGPVSLALFLAGLWLAWRAAMRIPDSGVKLTALLLFFFVILSSLTHTIHFTKWFWIPLMFVMVLAEHTRREQESVAPVRGTPVTRDELLRQLGGADAVVY